MSEAKRERRTWLGDRDHEVESHESYGIMRFSRFQGGGPMYGTPVETGGGVMFEMLESERHFDRIGGERFSSNGKIIARGRMSAVQFAEMITTMNQGEGVPVTLEHYRDGERLKECEDPPKQQSEARQIRDEFRQEIGEKLATLKSAKRRVGKLLDEANIGKGRREEIQREIWELMRLYEDSAPFVMGTFEEAADKTVARAKGELSAHVRLIAETTGLKQLQEQVKVPLLEDGTEDES